MAEVVETVVQNDLAAMPIQTGPINPDVNASLSKMMAAKKTQEQPETPTIETEATPDVVVPPTEPVVVKKETPTPEAAKKEAPAKADAPKGKGKKFWESAEQKAEATPPVATIEIPKDVQDELNILRDVLNKPSVKAVLEAEKSGKSLTDYIDEVRGKDPSKLSYTDLYKMKLLEGGKDAETVDAMAESFDLKDDVDKSFLLDEYRDRKVREYKESLDKLTPDILSERKKQIEINNKTMADYTAYIKQYEGKEYEGAGITITPERARELSDYYKTNMLLGVREDGTLNPADLMEFTTYKLYKKLIFENIYNNAYKEGFEALEREVTQPGGSLEATSVHTPTQMRKGPENEETKRMEALKKSLPSV